MKKLSLAILSLLMLFSLASCKKDDAEAKFDFTSVNDVLTYEKIDESKTQLVVSRIGNVNISDICSEFEKLNPEIQIIEYDITGGTNVYGPYLDYLAHGEAGDIVFSTGISKDNMMTYFRDLSSQKYTLNYYTSSLADYSDGGHVYALPGPSNLVAISYNKTLFEQYGWNVPNSFAEFVSLCNEITEDTDGAVEPFNPNGKYVNTMLPALTAFAYTSVIEGVENQKWLYNYINGLEGASFENHMEPLYEILIEMVENNIIREEHYTYGATDRLKNFKSGKIAMINIGTDTNYSDVVDYEIGYFAFPGKVANNGYLLSEFNYYLGIPKKENTAEVEAAISKFVEFISSPEGQELYIGNGMMLSNVIGTTIDTMGEQQHLQDIVADGRLFSELTFCGGTKITNAVLDQPNAIIYQQIKDMLINGVTKTPSELTQEYDLKIANLLNNASGQEEPKVLATVQTDFTTLEFSNYMADMFKEEMNADIGLVMNKAYYRGNVMNAYQGVINENMLSAFKPRSFANNSKLVKSTITGEQLLKLLNDPIAPDLEDTQDCIYAFSGLKATYKPWNLVKEKLVSATLADGTAIEMTKLYTIAYWEGTIKSEYLTTPTASCADSFEVIFARKLTKDQTIAPSNDNRITLVWN